MIFTVRFRTSLKAGAEHQSEANAFMEKVFKHPQMKIDFRYSSHKFVDKVSAGQLQCADLLAWHGFTYNQRERTGQLEKRKDFRSLLGKRVKFNHYDKEGIEKWLPTEKRIGHLQKNGYCGFQTSKITCARLLKKAIQRGRRRVETGGVPSGVR